MWIYSDVNDSPIFQKAGEACPGIALTTQAFLILNSGKYLQTRKLRKEIALFFFNEAFHFPVLIKTDVLCEDSFIYIEYTAQMQAFTLWKAFTDQENEARLSQLHLSPLKVQTFQFQVLFTVSFFLSMLCMLYV